MRNQKPDSASVQRIRESGPAGFHALQLGKFRSTSSTLEHGVLGLIRSRFIDRTLCKISNYLKKMRATLCYETNALGGFEYSRVSLLVFL